MMELPKYVVERVAGALAEAEFVMRELAPDNLLAQGWLRSFGPMAVQRWWPDESERDQHIAALEAELQPWREMMVWLNRLFNADYTVSIETEMGGFSVAAWPNSPEIVDPDALIEASGMTLPAAVAAAYGKVVGDE